jgi:hypothetical protein
MAAWHLPVHRRLSENSFTAHGYSAALRFTVQQMGGSEVGRQLKVAKYHVHIAQSLNTSIAGSE